MGLSRLQENKGISLAEVILVVVLMGVVASFAIPRALKTTPRQDVLRAAKQLTRDMEQVRTRAMSAKRNVRVRFTESARFYTAFMDTTTTRLGVYTEDSREVHESRLVAYGAHGGIPGVRLPAQVTFGAGAASSGPNGEPATDAIGLTNDQIEFNSRGLAVPLGTQGIVYLTHATDPSAVAAITISGAGGFQTWVYRNGGWER